MFGCPVNNNNFTTRKAERKDYCNTQIYSCQSILFVVNYMPVRVFNKKERVEKIMFYKLRRQAALLICMIFTAGLLSGCTGSILLPGEDGNTAIFAAGTLDSDSTLSKAALWLRNAFEKFTHPFEKEAEEYNNLSLVIPDQYQVLLIGSDRRDDSWNGNSDVMILASLNRSKKTISFISFMRDTGVNVPGVGYGKLNCSYAKGGSALLKSTLESNFQISIDNCIATDFTSMADIIDLFGGIDLDITDAEIPVINNCVNEMTKLRGLDPAAYQLTAAGYQHLNGIQAVGYMRDRYVGSSDFQRTQRQRIVLQKLLEKLKAMSMLDLLKISSSTAGLSIHHDFTADQIAGLAALALECRNYTVVMDRIPYDGLYTSNGENLDPVWPETIERLHATIY